MYRTASVLMAGCVVALLYPVASSAFSTSTAVGSVAFSTGHRPAAITDLSRHGNDYTATTTATGITVKFFSNGACVTPVASVITGANKTATWSPGDAATKDDIRAQVESGPCVSVN